MRLAPRPPVIVIAVVVACVLFGSGPQAATARLTSTTAVAANTFSTDILGPPSGLSGSGSLGNVNLTWTATTDAYATGYRVLKSSTSGGPYSLVGTVAGRTITNFLDTPGIGTRYYVVETYYQNWTSVSSNQVACIVVVIAFICT